MRTRQQLKETFNKMPRPEGVIQNQYLLLEVLCDIRDMLYGKKDNNFRAPWEDNSADVPKKDLDFIKDKKDEPI